MWNSSCALGSVGDLGPQSLRTFFDKGGHVFVFDCVCADAHVFFLLFLRQCLSLNLGLSDCLRVTSSKPSNSLLPQDCRDKSPFSVFEFSKFYLLIYLVPVCEFAQVIVCAWGGQRTSLGADSFSIMWIIGLCGKCLCPAVLSCWLHCHLVMWLLGS